MDGGPAAEGQAKLSLESDRHIVPVVACVLTQMVARNDKMLQQVGESPCACPDSVMSLRFSTPSLEPNSPRRLHRVACVSRVAGPRPASVDST